MQWDPLTEFDAREIEESLRTAYVDTVLRTALLRRHAEIAPQEYSAATLLRLAQLGDTQLDLLAEALTARAVALPPPPAVLADDSRNHWQRLVQDLERHTTAIERCQHAGIRFDRDQPLSLVFAELQRSCELQRRQLRGLIARADAQALD